MLEHIQAVANLILKDEDGQATTEYGLIVVLVSVIAIAVLSLIGGKIVGLLTFSF